MVGKERILMKIQRPYFLTNKEWYYFDKKEFCYKLTDKAPKLARLSYEAFYRELNGES